MSRTITRHLMGDCVRNVKFGQVMYLRVNLRIVSLSGFCAAEAEKAGVRGAAGTRVWISLGSVRVDGWRDVYKSDNLKTLLYFYIHTQ